VKDITLPSHGNLEQTEKRSAMEMARILKTPKRLFEPVNYVVQTCNVFDFGEILLSIPAQSAWRAVRQWRDRLTNQHPY
jgi:hypothetical protein